VINRIVLGDKDKIVEEKEAEKCYNEKFSTASAMEKSDLKEFLKKYFSDFNENQKEGLRILLELSWACANALYNKNIKEKQ